jgi:hypothetical protein
MSIETRHPKRVFPALAVADFAATDPGNARAIARRMVYEGAARLTRDLSPGSPAFGIRVDNDSCPLSRQRSWRARFFGRPIVASLAVLVLGGGAASAQVASASPAALGLGENYTAMARGLNAVAWNPASLGLPGAGPSFVTLVVRGASGLGPVGLSDIADWSDALVPVSVKQDWLARIGNGGGQVGSGSADVTWAALKVGPIAVHASSSARMTADVSPGVAELILFGNVGESGEARTLNLSGSNITGWAWSAVGASMALPIPLDAGQASIGVTVKYVMGHGMALGENSIGATTIDPIAVDLVFPLVHTDFEGDFALSNGTGMGIDLGASMQTGDWTISGVVQNVTNSFAWDTSKLRYRPLSVSLDGNEAVTETGDMPLVSAPAPILERVEALRFEPVYGGGLAWRYSYDLTFTADARFSSADGIQAGPSRHVGGGIEYYLSDWFPVRVGGAVISMGEGADGWQAGAGLGFEVGSWSIAGSALHRSAGRFGDATMVMVSLFGVGR